MHFHRALLLAMFPLLGLMLAGCLVTTNGTRVIRKDETRRPVQFESEQGLLDFNTAVRERGSEGGRRRGSSSFNVPFIISASSRHVLSWAAYFNDQVALADVDADGTLSDAEVGAFVGPGLDELPLEPSTRELTGSQLGRASTFAGPSPR